MPTYVYRCSYGHEFEVEQRITDPPITRCTKMSGSDPGGFGLDCPHVCDCLCKRVPQAPAFILRGNNWGRDGYSS